ncbi:hypothetical protein [Aquimarina sp. RZ0]|uniref:hypothetical protein n=1 Tax=Aquimarina sp. RZ0 TaxID=2607730 RepID=UPI00165FE534|nr:hypothetical protein [Aquimarina sp. RZ0]
MVTKLKNLGTPLTKNQKKINRGGFAQPCRTRRDCLIAFPFTGSGDFSCRYSLVGFG